MKIKPISRICLICGKDKGTLAFRYYQDKGWKRDYFHPRCFKKFKNERNLTLEEQKTLDEALKRNANIRQILKIKK